MTEFSHLKFDLGTDRVAVVTMNRAPANAVDQAMYRELAAFFREPDQIGDVGAIVLTGDGPHFCAGNDLDEFMTMSPENGTERMWRVREAFFAIQDCPVPVFGAVHGAALGTGLAIAASCDYVVASPDARFGLPELTVGVMGGARHLARMAPQPLVRRMYFTGAHLKAEEFKAAGACIEICEREKLVEQARSYAARAAGFSPTATRLAKQILNRIETMDLQTGYEFEQRYTVKMSGHPDSKEALNAFSEKRPPNYRDHDPRWAIEV